MGKTTLQRDANGHWLPAFDHDEARRLRLEEGLTYKQIAARFGVTYQAVFQVCPRERERLKGIRYARTRFLSGR